MTASWEQYGWGPWSADEDIPHDVPDEATLTGRGLPGTLKPVKGDGVTQSAVFDPSMKHHARAVRPSEPRFADATTGERWYGARRIALDHVLAAVAGGEWAAHLVLRGSVLLRARYGQAAREPGDVDFVVTPATWQATDARTERMLTGIARAAEELSLRGGPVRFDARGAVSDEIWTYDRVPGRRVVIPWTADGLPGGTVQVDFVFNEPLPVPAVPTSLPRPDGAGEPLTLLAATPGLSLAWKVLWLLSDMYPQGKDLYDALLLAEDTSTALPFDLLRTVFVSADGYYDRNPVLPKTVASCGSHADWYEFAKDCPHLAGAPGRPGDGPPADLVRRLTAALAPTFALDDGSGEPPAYQLRVAWLATTMAPFREALRTGGMDGLQEVLMTRYHHAAQAIVITRELLGREACDIARAAGIVAEYRASDRHPRADDLRDLLGDAGTAAAELSGRSLSG
ncbi:nucleotidyl transferase AbiEii/AbiGii toxin family protein [Streptomyces griseocarneus]|uniref:Nucleotidyl transferase AbiEii/AbiGii toxin family protein n=2 Tax=Streptomyces TaxID=1883 RepID=A0ABX7RWR1_9ACTN|nr:nucleotidyl transferase AbiEii/AbiGii toxin family protein [Streptomyces griseocarneus]